MYRVSPTQAYDCLSASSSVCFKHSYAEKSASTCKSAPCPYLHAKLPVGLVCAGSIPAGPQPAGAWLVLLLCKRNVRDIFCSGNAGRARVRSYTGKQWGLVLANCDALVWPNKSPGVLLR